MNPNLTEEQKDLLRTIVEVYNSGCKGAFILVRQLSGPSALVYERHPGVETEADVEDFNQLQAEGLISFRSTGDDFRGKPTAKGIAFAHQLAAEDDQLEPLPPGFSLVPPMAKPQSTANADYVLSSDGRGSFGVSGLTARAQNRTGGPPTSPSLTLMLRSESEAAAFVSAGEKEGFTFAGKELLGGRHSQQKDDPAAENKMALMSDFTRNKSSSKKTIFIGHGQSAVWRQLKDFLTERLGLKYDEFNAEAVAGKTTITRLQAMLEDAQFAFLVMTAEDTHADNTAHARENVIHEAGLFQGRLGFEKAIILLEEGCAEFSNIEGLAQIRFPKGNLEPSFEKIRHVLEREHIIK